MDGISKVWPKWEVVSVLGQGGYGRVYKVKRETFGEVSYAAVKVVKIPANQAEVDEMSTTGLDEGSITAYFKNVVVQMLSEIKTMEKMKSFWGSGIKRCFCLELPMPTPKKPPEPMAYKDCTV